MFQFGMTSLPCTGILACPIVTFRRFERTRTDRSVCPTHRVLWTGILAGSFYCSSAPRFLSFSVPQFFTDPDRQDCLSYLLIVQGLSARESTAPRDPALASGRLRRRCTALQHPRAKSHRRFGRQPRLAP